MNFVTQKIRLSLLLLVSMAAAGAPDNRPERLEWFQDLKFGFFMHWGIYSQWGCIESWPLVEADAWGRPDDLACWT